MSQSDSLGLPMSKLPPGVETGAPGEPPPGPDLFRGGGSVLSEAETEVLGDIEGLRVLHLLCGSGEETLSLVNMGASVTAVDEDTTEAEALATAAERPVDFVQADPCDIPEDLRTGDFDLVYSGFGMLSEIDSVDAWAASLASALAQGGRLVMYDEHPLAYVVGAGGPGVLAVTSSYFGVLGDDEVLEDEDQASAAQAAGPDATEGEGNVLGWTLGDIVTALGDSGLATVQLRELYRSPRFTTPLDDIDVDAALIARVPGVLLLEARKIE
jgi:SAM-dependent methyltransferase